MRQAKITRTLEDGTIEETYIDLETKTIKKPVKKSKGKSNENNKKQKEEQTSTVSSKIKITS